jgi:adenylosuccinate synthase
VRLNGMDGLCLTKLDVLGEMPEVAACVAYELDGRELDELPLDLEDMQRAKPVWARWPGWGPMPAGVRSVDELPAPARRYVEAIEKLSGVPFYLVSVGADRADTAIVREAF